MHDPRERVPLPVAVFIHVSALVVITMTLVYLAARYGEGEVLVAALLGFGGGMVFDRWVLRPTVDVVLDHHAHP